MSQLSALVPENHPAADTLKEAGFHYTKSANRWELEGETPHLREIMAELASKGTNVRFQLKEGPNYGPEAELDPGREKQQEDDNPGVN